jgi:hypothetical protein
MRTSSARRPCSFTTPTGGPSPREESRKRKREESPNQQHEQFAARRAQHKARLTEAWRARERAREQARMAQDPFNDMPGRGNCTFCSLAGLSDVDRLATFFREKNLDSSDPNAQLTGME